MKTHDIGPLFWHTIRLKPGTPRLHRAVSNETDPPFRSAHPRVLRVGHRGLVFGKWQKEDRTEEQALVAAMTSAYEYDRPQPGAVVVRIVASQPIIVETPEWAEFDIPSPMSGAHLAVHDNVITITADRVVKYRVVNINNFGRTYTGRLIDDGGGPHAVTQAPEIDRDYSQQILGSQQLIDGVALPTYRG